MHLLGFVPQDLIKVVSDLILIDWTFKENSLQVVFMSSIGKAKPGNQDNHMPNLMTCATIVKLARLASLWAPSNIKHDGKKHSSERRYR